MTEKITMRKRTYTLKDGTICHSRSVKRYYVLGPDDVDKRLKLTPEQKREIYARHLIGVSVTRLAKDFNVAMPTIKRAIEWTEANKTTHSSDS